MQDTLIIKTVSTVAHTDFTILILLFIIWILVYWFKNKTTINNINVYTETSKVSRQNEVFVPTTNDKIKLEEPYLIPSIDLDSIKDINITNEKL